LCEQKKSEKQKTKLLCCCRCAFANRKKGSTILACAVDGENNTAVGFDFMMLMVSLNMVVCGGCDGFYGVRKMKSSGLYLLCEKDEEQWIIFIV
jgi:hypothetical protein